MGSVVTQISAKLYVYVTTARYWPKVADERKRKPYSIILADKNAPNEEVWRQVNFLFVYFYIMIH
jgi:hypothetical protein